VTTVITIYFASQGLLVVTTVFVKIVIFCDVTLRDLVENY